MLRRSFFLLVAPGAAVIATTAHAAAPTAAPRPLVFADQAGDANAINGHDVLPLAEGTPTATSEAAYDLRSMTVGATGTTTTRKVRGRTVRQFRCTGYTATIELAAAPKAQDVLYRVQALRNYDVNGTNGTFFLEYHTPSAGDPVSVPGTWLRFKTDPGTGDAKTKTVALQNAARIAGNRITFVVTAADLAQAGERLGGGMVLSHWAADVRGNLFVGDLPQWDQIEPDPAVAWPVCPA